jgi:hypothetical protein
MNIILKMKILLLIDLNVINLIREKTSIRKKKE